MQDTIRAFIAFELPENIISSIRDVQEGMQSYGFKVRWVQPENIHLSLKFLGDIHEADIKKIGAAITGTAKKMTPLSIAAKGIGVFPGMKRSRVIWIGLTGEMGRLIALQKMLDEELGAIGFPKEKRPFKGHLTLGRVKGKLNPERFIAAMKKFQEFKSETFAADNVFLFKSDLRPTGSVYARLMSVNL